MVKPMNTVDPVCGMEISEHNSGLCTDYAGTHYCFCSEECLEEFQDDPELYIGDSAKAE